MVIHPSDEDLKNIYQEYFSLKFLGTDITNKFAVISLICYLTKKIREKNPSTDCYKILKQISKSITNGPIPNNILKGLAIVCEDFGYGCRDFPTFEIKDKDIPSKIKELLEKWLPF